MHNFVRNLLTEWRKLKLPFGDAAFVVAISGGADSVALALALEDLKNREKLNLRFVLAHYNHDLRGEESEKDAEFVGEFAGKFGFELALRKGKFQRQGNLEQNARHARYRFLFETAGNIRANGILTAHTINDQAETFLMNLIRGSGVAGLSAMKLVISDFKFQVLDSENKSQIPNPKSQIALVRPLLSWATREETENYCRFREIEFRYDSMNEDLNFTRVRIRKVLLPLLKDFNPKIIERLAKTAALLQSDDHTETENPKPKNAGEFLTLKELKTLRKPVLYKVLRQFLEAHRGGLRGIDLKHIEAIESLIFTRKSGQLVELPGGETVVKKSGKLFWMKKNIENIE